MFWDKKNICAEYCVGCHFRYEWKKECYCVNEIGSVTISAQDNIGQLSYTGRHICRGLMIKKNCPFYQKRINKK